MTTQKPFISAHPDPEGEVPMGMQCVVQEFPEFTDAEISHAVAVAVLNYLDLAKGNVDMQTAVDNWMRGRIRKVVRKARNIRWEKVQLEEGLTTVTNGVAVRVFTPRAIDSTPKSIRNCQVSNIHSTGDGLVLRGDYRPCLQIFTNRNLNMSPGKTAVAAAHVAQLMAKQLLPEDYELWKSHGFPMGVASNSLLHEGLERFADVTIHDGGLTEVEPGSITAMGCWVEAKEPTELEGKV